MSYRIPKYYQPGVLITIENGLYRVVSNTDTSVTVKRVIDFVNGQYIYSSPFKVHLL